MLAANSTKQKTVAAVVTGDLPAAASSLSTSSELKESEQYFPQLVFVVLDEVDALGRGDGVNGELQVRWVFNI